MVNLANIRKKAKDKRQEPSAAPDSSQAQLQQDVTPAPEEVPTAPQSVEAAEPELPKPEPPKPAPKTEASKKAAPVKTARKKTDAQSIAEPVAEPQEPVTPEERDTPQARAARSKLDAFKESAGVNRFDAGEEGATAEASGAGLRELLTFGLAGEHYAIDIESIVEITPPRQATRIPNADPGVVGIISLRGTIVTVLNLRQILGHASQHDAGPDARIIVLEQAGQTSGFLVDRVFRVAKIGRGALAAAPVVSTAEQSAYIEGVFYHNNVLTIVLNLERLLKG